MKRIVLSLAAVLLISGCRGAFEPTTRDFIELELVAYPESRAQSEDARLRAYERKKPADPGVANVEGNTYLCETDHFNKESS